MCLFLQWRYHRSVSHVQRWIGSELNHLWREFRFPTTDHQPHVTFFRPPRILTILILLFVNHRESSSRKGIYHLFANEDHITIRAIRHRNRYFLFQFGFHLKNILERIFFLNFLFHHHMIFLSKWRISFRKKNIFELTEEKRSYMSDFFSLNLNSKFYFIFQRWLNHFIINVRSKYLLASIFERNVNVFATCFQSLLIEKK